MNHNMMRFGTTTIILALACLLLPPPAAAGGADVDARYREAAAVFHGLRTNDNATPQDWRTLANVFDSIAREHPTHGRAPDALFSAALALRQAFAHSDAPDDLQRAEDAFRFFLAAHPEHRLADDSLMHLADLQTQARQEPHAAAATYRRVLQDYARGDQATLARERLAALAGSLARSESDPPGHTTTARGSAGGSGTLKRVQSWSALGSTRIILTTDRKSGYRHGLLPAGDGLPARLYVDLEETEPADDLDMIQEVDDAALRRIRVARQPGGATRVVLDLKRIEDYAIKDFHLPAEKKIVIDLRPPEAALVASAAVPRQDDGYHSRRFDNDVQGPPEERLALSRAFGLKVKTLVIDAGHGGHDPGAIGFGLQEKDLALDIAQRLRRVIERNRPGLRVGMTREDDSFVPLEERPRIAKDQNADLFISIHLNANPTERISGIETYFLNLTADAAAIQVAARENALTEKKVSNLNLILTDLLQDANILESNRLARTLQASLVGELLPGFPVRNLGVKQAPFLVLIGSEMPSVLVEAGFITNRSENSRFRDSHYREKVAEGIYAGLSDYISGDALADKKPPAPVKLAKADS